MPSALETKLKNLVNIPKRLPSSPMVPPSLLAKFLLPRKVKAVHTPQSAHYGPEDIGTQERGKLRESRAVEEEPEPPEEPTTAEQVHAGQDVLKTGEGFQGRQANPVRGVGHGGARYKDPKVAAEERRSRDYGENPQETTKGTSKRAAGGKYATPEAERLYRDRSNEYNRLKRKWQKEGTPVIPFAQWREEQYPGEVARGEAAKRAGKVTTAGEQEFLAGLSEEDRALATEIRDYELKPKMRQWRSGLVRDPEKKAALRHQLIEMVYLTTGKSREEAAEFVDKQWAVGQPKATARKLGERETEDVPSQASRYPKQQLLPGMEYPSLPLTTDSATQRDVQKRRGLEPKIQGTDPYFSTEFEPTAEELQAMRDEQLQELGEPKRGPLKEHRSAKEGWEVRVPETYTRRVYDENGKEKKPIVEKGWDTQYIPFGENEPDTGYSQAVEDDLFSVLQVSGMQNYVEEAPRYTATQAKDGSLKNLTKTVVLKPAKAFREAEFREGGGEPASPEQLRRILYGFGGPDYPIDMLPDIISVNIGQERTKRTVQAVTEPRISIKIPLDQEEFQSRINGALEWFETGRARDWEDTEKYAYYLMKTNPETTPDDALKQVKDIQEEYERTGLASRFRKRTGEKRPSSRDRAANQSLKEQQAALQRQHEENQRKDRVDRQKDAAEKAALQAEADRKRVQERQAEIEDQQIRDEQERLRRSRLQGGTGPR